MINNYSLFYEYKPDNDILYIFIDELISSYKEESFENVTRLIRENKFIGYKIFNIKNIIKIKTSGMIYLPHPLLVEVINNILKRNKLEEISLKPNSNYVVGKIVNISSSLKVDIGDRIITCPMTEQATIDDLVVVALKGTGLKDKSIVNTEGYICSYKDLDINDDLRPFVLDEETKIGIDFFLMEEK